MRRPSQNKKNIIKLKEDDIVKLKEKLEKINEGAEKDNDAAEEEREEKERSLPFKTVINTLEHHTFVGTVRQEGIKLQSLNCVVVIPSVPILPDVSYIDKKEFREKVDYRSDYSSFLAFNDHLFRTIVVPEEADSFPYKDINEKNSILFERLVGKTILFRPEFKEVEENGALKLNAIITDIVDYSGFANAVFVPAIQLTKKAFEETIAKGSDLELLNYPVAISSSLKYVLVKDTVYEIDYVPNYSNSSNPYSWRMNSETITRIPGTINLLKNNENCILVKRNNSEDTLVGLYIKRTELTNVLNKHEKTFDEIVFLNDVSDNAANKNLFYTPDDITNFHVAIKSSNLVILAGPSGIGKTRLPLLYSSTLGLENTRNSVLFVPISPSYIEPEDILGYLKPITNDDANKKMQAEYIESSTSLVSFLLDASRNRDNIHFVIFDEMNLSQIEHWFAPFLSIMERDPDDRNLVLYPDNNEVINGDYPSTIQITDNVFFIGTVNVDETTKPLSDRLLDRAIVINLKKSTFKQLKEMKKPISIKKYPEVKFNDFSKAIVYKDNYISEFSENELDLLDKINDLMLKSALHKGISFRTIKKISQYLANSTIVFERKDAFDYAVMEMIVSRISGTREELSQIFTPSLDSGLFGLLNNYSSISGFSRTKELINEKISDINLYGYAN